MWDLLEHDPAKDLPPRLDGRLENDFSFAPTKRGQLCAEIALEQQL